MQDFEVDKELSESALPPVIEELSVPSPLAFAPWHKPRKQYVRRHQWVHHAVETIRKLKARGEMSEGDTISYLTLPGPDMLDVRMIAEACREEGVRLRYTGFCSVVESDALRLRRNTAQFQIDLNGVIQSGSEVHTSRLEEIVIHGSAAQTMMERGGPYNVINLDACEPLAHRDASHTGRLIDAVRKIMSYQFDRCRHPWLLYLTTPVQTDWISPESLDSLKSAIRQNCDSDADFNAALSKQFAPEEDLSAYFSRASSQNGEVFCSMFSLGIAKWLLHLAEQAKFDMVKMKSFTYSMVKRAPQYPNMVSTCYLFLPRPVEIKDLVGLTTNVEQRAATTLRKSAHLRALDRSVSLVNLDSLFAQDTKVADEMRKETKGLLSLVGYDVDDPGSGYDAWLQAQEVVEPELR